MTLFDYFFIFKSFIGVITHVEPDLISYCLNSDQIPIIANSIGESISSNEYLYLDINHVTLELAIKFKPLKVINLNYNGGLLDHDEKVKQNLIKYFFKTLFLFLLIKANS
jgi:acetylglutamate kinase